MPPLIIILSRISHKLVCVFLPPVLLCVVFLGNELAWGAPITPACRQLADSANFSSSVGKDACCCSMARVPAQKFESIAVCSCAAEKEAAVQVMPGDFIRYFVKVSSLPDLCVEQQKKYVYSWPEHYVDSGSIPIYILHCALLL